MGKLIELTTKQREIINLIPDNNVQIIACAGAGKTEVVSRGAAEIIKRGVPPAQVVAFTFTEKAAEELKARIRQVLIEVVPDKADISETYVGTIHSYCFETLKDLFPKYKSYAVLDEAKRVAFLSKPYNYYNILRLNRLESRGKNKDLNKYTVIDRFISSVDIYLNENVKSESLDPEIRESIETYFALLEQEKYLDFSTMIHTLVNMTETNAPYKALLRKTLRNLIIDEYQDINALQARLIRTMVGTNTKICVVGDDDQCIYNWRGSIVDFIIDFKKGFPDAEVRRLEHNFRSTGSVIDLAGRFIAKNKKRLNKKMKHVDGEKSKSQKGDIQYFHFDEEQEQAEFIVNRTRELLGTDFISKSGTKYSLSLGDIAILTRSNDDIARLLPVLGEARIRYVVDSGRYIFETAIVKLAMSAIDYIFDLTPPPESGLSDNYKDVFTSAGYSLSCHDSFIQGINRIRREMRRIAERSQNDYLPELGLQGIYHGILSCAGTGFLDITEADHFYLASLSQAISDYESVWRHLRHKEIKYFRGFVKAWGQSNYRDSMSSEAVNVPAMKIMTIHKAKGLEFPVVFIPFLNNKQKRKNTLSFIDEKIFDSARYHGDTEDERRVYYVAFTRSERYLFLSGMKNDITVKKPRLPHEIVGELDASMLDRPQKLKRQASGYPPRTNREDQISTSFSELSAYGRCAYDYKLRHYIGYNAGVPTAFGYGSRIHDILNIIHREYKDSPPSEKVIDDLVDKHFFLRYAPGDTVKNMKKAAKTVIRNYVAGHADDFRNILETEKKFEFMLEDDSIAGQIDLIKKIDSEGSLREIEVVDFKSDSSLLYKKDYEHQLRLYVMACISALKLRPQKACIHDLENGKKKYIDISEDMLKITKNELVGRIGNIKIKKFIPQKDKEICKQCDYHLVCRFNH